MTATFSSDPIFYLPASSRGGQPAALESRRLSDHHYRTPLRKLVLRVVLPAERRSLGLTLVPGFLQDGRDVGVGDEALPACLIPVEEHPDLVVLTGIAKHCCAFGAVLLSLLSAFG